MPVEPVPNDLIPSPQPTFAEYIPEHANFSGEPTVPEFTLEPSLEDAGESLGADATPAPAPRKRVQMSKKMKKAMDKFVRQIAEFPALYFHNAAATNPEWELDEDEKEMLTDSVSMVFEILDVEFEIEPLNMTLTSIWWIISYPFVVFGYIFLTKKSKIETKEKE
jgi:hypothetical protein